MTFPGKVLLPPQSASSSPSPPRPSGTGISSGGVDPFIIRRRFNYSLSVFLFAYFTFTFVTATYLMSCRGRGWGRSRWLLGIIFLKLLWFVLLQIALTRCTSRCLSWVHLLSLSFYFYYLCLFQSYLLAYSDKIQLV